MWDYLYKEKDEEQYRWYFQQDEIKQTVIWREFAAKI